MCHSQAKYILLIALFFLGSIPVFAQTNTTSNPTNGRENNPYSEFGIGELWNGNNTTVRGMANVTSAYANPYTVNSDNPASYAYLKRTTFEIGATASTRVVDGGGQSYGTGTASLSYLNIGIPVGKNAGICLGFRPYTHVYYSLVDTIFAPQSPIGETIKSYNGEGSINYAYIGAAAKFKGLSIGFNVGYMFGNIQNTTATVPADTLAINTGYTAEYTNYTRIGGIYWKAGAMYEAKLDSDYDLRVGGTVTLSQNISERLDAYQISTFSFSDTTISDTSASGGQKKGNLKLPLSYSLGVILSKNDRWSIGADYTATQWSNFQSDPNTAMTTNVGKQSYKVSLGGELTPEPNSIHNYFAKVTYRFGIYYGTDYLNIDGTALPNYGFTFGGSLPFRRSFSHVHAAFDIGRLGTTANSLIQETYVRFTLGASFNDLWFIKRRYE